MNPLTPNAVRTGVRREVALIREAWPTATATWTPDELAATLIVRDPLSTYVIVVDGTGVRSLWVSHHEPIREGYVPEWQEGWVD